MILTTAIGDLSTLISKWRNTMKKIIITLLIVCTPLSISATEIVAPDMELGHWVTTTDTSDIIEQTLAAMPEASRATMRKMMQTQMKGTSTTEQCITKELLDNYEQQAQAAYAKQSDCEFNVVESTDKKFVATISCAGTLSTINTKFISAKLNESTVTTKLEGGGETKIATVSEWKSSTCPKGL
jgi:hypothetical protein